ncbi:P-loop containing nucleoside triphosphate hydrolase protein [Tribonema minus]|uniref:P-loop containing nucleoside triphosphate hydrolase protein n=1 Tax=Tribonema minus TaxID=303371 RepID=A0A835ZHA6_9STRA|nr:P-loop containing nucleoside triphosphate hydrolase protein [Tribonema minus]
MFVWIRHGPALPSHAAVLRASGERIHVVGPITPLEAPPGYIAVHVTELVAEGEHAARVLDAVAREAFPLIPHERGTIHVLHAPAGGGKTTSIINLCRAQRSQRPDRRILIAAFNRCAAQEGASRTADDAGIVWKTIDALLHEMYGSELTEELRGDSGNAVGVRALCARLFSLGISSAEARLVSRQLQDALNRGAVGDLVGTALRLFRAAERGEWFDFATLRMRARGDPRWSAALQDYDVVIIDEAQDLNVVMAELVMEVAPQKMLIFVGDGGQKLYAFMACRDVTEILPPESFNAWILYLSFRYGKKVCDLINTLQLPLVPTFAAEGAPDTLVQAVGSGLEVAEPHVSLFATWADAIAAANKYLERGRSVSMDSVKRHELLEAACSEDDDAGYQQVLKRVSRAGALRILSAIRDAGEDAMDVFISTVHGYKFTHDANFRLVLRFIYREWRPASSS